MKKFAKILLISAFAAGVLGAIMFIQAKPLAHVNGGWGALALGGIGLMIIGAAILLALSGGAILLDMYCISRKNNKLKRKNNNEPKN